MTDNTAITALDRHIGLSTVEYRKGAEVEQKGGATHVYAMPPTPDRGVLVDVHFINVGFTEAANRDEFLDLLIAALSDGGEGEFTAMSVTEFLGGPSYITLGAWLGSQDLALRFIGLVELHKLGKAVTPGRLGIDGEVADQLAGSGMVMVAPNSDLADSLRLAVA